MSSTILSLRNLSRSYGKLKALNNVSFDIPTGSVFGILGPNGSGKTTLLGSVLGVLAPDSGQYSWMGGLDQQEARRRIGALLETPNFYHYLSAYQNLEITAAIRGRGQDDRQRVLELTGLAQRQHSKFSTFSLGMKQRLAIAAALLGQPKVLVLDEPTNGLDPAGIAEIRELILKLHQQGYTIIIASHLLAEVERVCTHVAILKYGNLLVCGTVADALRNEDEIELGAEDSQMVFAFLNNHSAVKSVTVANNMIHVLPAQNVTPAKINKICADAGITLSHLALKKKSLETRFMELTN